MNLTKYANMNKTANGNNKRILRNTILLYLREILTLVITLYSSRVLFQQLGVEDFGLYGLIGSILMLFNSLRVLFSTSIQRFINVEKGRGNNRDVSKIFSLGVIIHAYLSVVFFIIVEIAGIISIPYLNIPETSVVSAHWVLQFSILSAVVTIMTVPYDALIIANEKFDALAVLSIVESLLKLCIIYLLVFIPVDKVIVYSALMFAVSLAVRFANAVYCSRRFKDEARFVRVKDKTYLKEMTVFAGWQFFGNMGFSLMSTGLNFVLNIFGGVAVNAARTIAYQVLNAVQKFTGSINMSFQPQSIMSYSCGDIGKFNTLIAFNSKASVAVTSVLGFVIAVLSPSILKLWLDDVPCYAVTFVQSIFLYAILRSSQPSVSLVFKASGQIKKYNIIEFVIQALNIPVSCFFLSIGAPFYCIFIIMAVLEIIELPIIIYLAKWQLGFDAGSYLRKVFIRILILLCILGLAFTLLFYRLNIGYSFFSTIVKAFICFVFSASVTLPVMFTVGEMKKMLSLLKRKVITKE